SWRSASAATGRCDRRTSILPVQNERHQEFVFGDRRRAAEPIRYLLQPREFRCRWPFPLNPNHCAQERSASKVTQRIFRPSAVIPSGARIASIIELDCLLVVTNRVQEHKSKTFPGRDQLLAQILRNMRLTYTLVALV